MRPCRRRTIAVGDKNVLRLNVPVAHALAVAVLERGDELARPFAHECLGDRDTLSPRALNVSSQVVFAPLHDDADVQRGVGGGARRGGVQKIIYIANNAGMFQVSKILRFALRLRCIVNVADRDIFENEPDGVPARAAPLLQARVN